MKKSRYLTPATLGVDLKKNKSLARVALTLGVMDYLDKSTKKTADNMYDTVIRGIGGYGFGKSKREN